MKVLSPRGFVRDLSRSRDPMAGRELASPEVLAQVWAYKRAKRFRGMAYAVSGLAAGGVIGVALFLGVPIVLHAVTSLYGVTAGVALICLLLFVVVQMGIRAGLRNSVSKVRRLPGAPREHGSPSGAQEFDAPD